MSPTGRDLAPNLHICERIIPIDYLIVNDQMAAKRNKFRLGYKVEQTLMTISGLQT